MLDIAADPPERKNNPNVKAFKWIVVDSAIIAAIAALAQLPESIPTLQQAYVILKTFLYAFVIQLAAERGIKYYVKCKKAKKSKRRSV